MPDAGAAPAGAVQFHHVWSGHCSLLYSVSRYRRSGSKMSFLNLLDLPVSGFQDTNSYLCNLEEVTHPLQVSDFLPEK